MNDIGARIRDARASKGWTLETLASQSGLSAGFLSQVERGLSTLSIVSLASICRALDLPIESLFVSSGPLDRRPPVVTKSDQQLLIRIGGSPVSYRYLSGQLPSAPVEELLIAEFPPDCAQQGSSHEGQEFGYLLEGAVELTVQEETYALAQGDSYHISASEPHGYRTSNKGAKILMAVTQRFIDIEPG
jgi:transcriptional regulator with XRE-family HTH domain